MSRGSGEKKEEAGEEGNGEEDIDRARHGVERRGMKKEDQRRRRAEEEEGKWRAISKW